MKMELKGYLIFRRQQSAVSRQHSAVGIQVSVFKKVNIIFNIPKKSQHISGMLKLSAECRVLSAIYKEQRTRNNFLKVPFFIELLKKPLHKYMPLRSKLFASFSIHQLAYKQQFLIEMAYCMV